MSFKENLGGDGIRLGIVGVGAWLSKVNPETLVSYLTIAFILFQAVMYSPRVYAALQFWYKKLKGESTEVSSSADST